MEYFIDPDRERFGMFKDLPREGKIHMLNLVKLNDVAVYEDGTKTTGKEAYAAYGRNSGPIFKGLGGEIIWSGSFQLMLIGPQEEDWDICFIAEYPSAEAFISMIRNPDYQKAVKHRQAAVKTSRLVRTTPKEVSGGFG
ncbi:DUF1330 domain-containing protein [Alphaproteobacteria bacterium]|jgi:uncharacterized protein (DUF1330 family)|nr:DUF1330 domain-containing protein [Alphaproteobacteria bacterium]